MSWSGWQFLRRKKRFTGIDIGSRQIKLATVALSNGVPEVVALFRRPSPPGVWSEEGDDEALVAALNELAEPGSGPVATALGKRTVKIFGQADQPAGSRTAGPLDDFSPGLGGEGSAPPVAPAITVEVSTGREGRGISMEISSALIYRCYSIFARAGLPLQAIDLDFLALWRLLGRGSPGTTAILDLGAARHLLLITSGGSLRRVVDWAAESLPVDDGLAGEAAQPAGGWAKTAGRLWQSLPVDREGKGEPVVRVLLTGGGSRDDGLIPELRRYGLEAVIAHLQLRLAPHLDDDPVYAVAVGLALKGVLSGGS